MAQDRQLSPDLQAFPHEIFEEHAPSGLGRDLYPSIMWSLGGEMRRGDEPPEQIGPHYALGYVRREALHRFEAIAHRDFGWVAFQPSKDDEASGPGTVDVEDRRILVRHPS